MKKFKNWCFHDFYTEDDDLFGDALTCKKCGFSRYPEVFPLFWERFYKILGRIHPHKSFMSIKEFKIQLALGLISLGDLIKLLDHIHTPPEIIKIIRKDNFKLLSNYEENTHK